jgi:hypothetical protein
MRRQSPIVVASSLVAAYPEFLLLDPKAQALVLGGITKTQEFHSVIEWIESNPPPVTGPILPAGLLANLAPVLAGGCPRPERPGRRPPALRNTSVVHDPLPGNADSFELLFGGLGGWGGDDWQRLPIAAGAILTFVLDVSIPAIVRSSGSDQSKDPTLGTWFQGLLADPGVVSSVLTAGAPFAADLTIIDIPSLLAAISAQLPSLMTGSALKSLRAMIDAKLGAGSVEAAATSLGWSAQMFSSLLAWAEKSGAVCAQSRMLANPATSSLRLSPTTAVNLRVTIDPDPTHGDWPSGASSYAVQIEYGGGFTQDLSGPLPANKAESRSASRSAPYQPGARSVSPRHSPATMSGSAPLDRSRLTPRPG